MHICLFKQFAGTRDQFEKYVEKLQTKATIAHVCGSPLSLLQQRRGNQTLFFCFLLLVNSGKTDVFPVQANPLPNYYLNFSLQDFMQVHLHSLCVG